MEKIVVDLKQVQETLLLPLWGRAVETRKPRPLLTDTRAVEIMDSLSYDFSRIARNTRALTRLAWIGRALLTDTISKQFLSKYPDAAFVNMGCGLDTNFERIDNGKLWWYDIDLPEVIDLRKKFFRETERRKFIASSLTDYGWMEPLKTHKHILFVAAGVMYYFDENAVKEILVKMAETFPGCEFLLDVASPTGVKVANKVVIRNTGMDDKSILKWGLSNPSEIETWSSMINVERQYSFFTDIRKKLLWREMAWSYFSDYLKIMYMIHLDFRAGAST